MLGERLSLPESIHGLFGQLAERWDGKGGFLGLKGDAIPFALRIVAVARDASIPEVGRWSAVHRRRCPDARRRGHDPQVAEGGSDHADELVPDGEELVWDVVCPCEPVTR